MPDLNKTVYLGNGSTMLCTYNPDDLTMGPLWITVFAISLLLNLFAILGNTVIVTACFLQKRRPAVIVYIHALAISDLCYSLLAPLYIYRYVLQYMPQYVINFTLAAELSHHITGAANTFSSVSSWLVVALTIDRVILVRFPGKAAVLSTKRRALLAVLLIIICCVALNAVVIYELFEVPIIILPCLGYWSVPDAVTLEDGSIYATVRSQAWYKIYAILNFVVFLYALPTIVLVVCNTIILKRYKILSKRERAATSSSTKLAKRKAGELQFTKMIVAVNVIFIICNMPDVITRLLWKFISPLIVANIQPIAHLLLMINVAANFIVYAGFNKTLFRTLVRMLKKCRGNTITYSSSSDQQQQSLSKTNCTQIPKNENIELTTTEATTN